nr:type VII secretion target [Mycolicibacterium cosmeticum]
MGEPLRVDPEELGLTAGQLEGHAAAFAADHEAAHTKAAGVTLGSASGAALAGMLSAWEGERAQFGAVFTGHADAHREAARRYLQGDDRGAEAIGDAASSM